MDKPTMDVKLQYSRVQRIVTDLETENSKLQEEITELRLENMRLQTQITQLKKESRRQAEVLAKQQQEETEALLGALEERDTEVQTLKTKLAKRRSRQNSSEAPISSVDDLEIKIEDLEESNDQKDKEINALKYRLVGMSRDFREEVKDKDKQIHKLNMDLLDELSYNATARSQLLDREATIRELQHCLEEKSHSLRLLRSKLKQIGNSTAVEGTDCTPGIPRECGEVLATEEVGTDLPVSGDNQLTPGYRFPEEDHTFRWKICACGHDDCPTCVAERAAVAQSSWKSCCKCGGHHHSEQKSEWVGEGKQQDWEEDDSYYFGDTEDTRHVRVVKDPGSRSYKESKMFIYLFHVSISDSAVSQHTEAECSTCSISALLFAHKYKTYPSSMDPEGVSDELFSQVLDSINEASETMRLNYKGRTDQLRPGDTLLVTGHLGLRLKESNEPDCSVPETLMPYIFHMEPGQILLFYRMRPYKVLSITSSEDGEKVLMFDPQWHSVPRKKKKKSKNWYGACLFSVARDVELIEEMLEYVEKYCGLMLGKCKLAILELPSKDS